MTKAPSQETMDMVDEARRPKGEMILTDKGAVVVH